LSHLAKSLANWAPHCAVFRRCRSPQSEGLQVTRDVATCSAMFESGQNVLKQTNIIQIHVMSGEGSVFDLPKNPNKMRKNPSALNFGCHFLPSSLKAMNA